MSEEVVKYPNFNAALAPTLDEPEGEEPSPLMAPTVRLRFLGSTLQQFYVDMSGGGSDEWRDVETVEE